MSDEPPEPIYPDDKLIIGGGSYRQMYFRLLAELSGDDSPLPDDDMPERDDQKIAVLIRELFGISPEYWSKRSEAEREPWLKQALERVCATVTDDDQNEPTVDCPAEPSVDCSAELQPYLGLELTAAEIAYMVFRKSGSIKRQHKLDWGEPDEPSAGRRPAKWKLCRILPALKKQFGDRIRPPQASIEDD